MSKGFSGRSESDLLDTSSPPLILLPVTLVLASEDPRGLAQCNDDWLPPSKRRDEGSPEVEGAHSGLRYNGLPLTAELELVVF